MTLLENEILNVSFDLNYSKNFLEKTVPRINYKKAKLKNLTDFKMVDLSSFEIESENILFTFVPEDKVQEIDVVHLTPLRKKGVKPVEHFVEENVIEIVLPLKNKKSAYFIEELPDIEWPKKVGKKKNKKPYFIPSEENIKKPKLEINETKNISSPWNVETTSTLNPEGLESQLLDEGSLDTTVDLKLVDINLHDVKLNNIKSNDVDVNEDINLNAIFKIPESKEENSDSDEKEKIKPVIRAIRPHLN